MPVVVYEIKKIKSKGIFKVRKIPKSKLSMKEMYFIYDGRRALIIEVLVLHIFIKEKDYHLWFQK